ncbi:GIY-YIG nuclease family protein [Levilactobacillus acidifarinae]|uniref:GIY-YIG nuclease family protein n=1 Tax=Levilactobacillus acidifarinae TaxID=267364 RepID=UPI000AE9ED74|nr:GIY-YIG nuclease family protein [Levilactobacillus acidifarinae]GEO69242.1 hypothetical protein LAC03_11520 [Levilactobacillus acidifarinae]
MKSTIKLNDLLHLSDLKHVKINFNVSNGEEDPLEVYKQNPDAINHGWLLHKGNSGNNDFPVGTTMVGLVRLSNNPDLWLLTTVAEITESFPATDAVGYKSHDLAEYAAYYGRVIVHFHNQAMTTNRWAESILDDLTVDQILPEVLQDDAFPGYENVRLSYAQLKQVIDHQKPDWIAALENQKAVYLITDTSNGKLYVGSATSKENMLLSRWTTYVKTGHGGNEGLKALTFEHIQQYFQYSILENYNSRVDDDTILARESWWKKTLMTRSFGYNQN